MILTTEQSAALDLINAWLKSDDWEFRLGGYAGTGKTFLLQYLINNHDHPMVCCAPTGKAASVLRSKLNGMEVITVHKAIYRPLMHGSTPEFDRLTALLVDDPNDVDSKLALMAEKKNIAENSSLGFAVKDETIIEHGQLVIVDEASMVTKQMRIDLQNTGCKALFVGDPGQLPPVGDGGWFIKGEFDYVLRTIQRQALDSPIIRMSMEIREGGLRKSNYQTGDCKIVPQSHLTEGDWLAADQVITGRNTTRHRLNRYFRKRLGFEGDMPAAGEKLICLKNENHEGQIFINGVQCTSLSAAEYDAITNSNSIILDYEGEAREIVFYDHHCRSHYTADMIEDPWFARRYMREIDYGYAITVHKSQGSEWDYVIIADDKMRRQDRMFRKQWLYTAVTRAKHKLLWLQD